MGYHLHVASKTIAGMIAIEVEWKERVEEWKSEMTLSNKEKDGEFDFSGTPTPGGSDAWSDHWSYSEDARVQDDEVTEKEE
jgi:hypothetical protein